VTRRHKGSSQAAWALLTEGVTSASVHTHAIRHLINRALKVLEQAPPEERERIYQALGDVITALPDRMDRLETTLDRTSYALIKMGDDFFGSRLPQSSKAWVNDAVESTFFVRPQLRLAAHILADRYLSRRGYRAPLTGPDTFTTLRSQKGLPPESYPERPLPLPRERESWDDNRVQHIPQPHVHSPERLSSWSMELPERSSWEKARTIPEEGEEYGSPYMDQGHTLKQRRPWV